MTREIYLLKNIHKVPVHSNFSDKQWHIQKLATVEEKSIYTLNSLTKPVTDSYTKADESNPHPHIYQMLNCEAYI
jgi:hypothetical protein